MSYQNLWIIPLLIKWFIFNKLHRHDKRFEQKWVSLITKSFFEHKIWNFNFIVIQGKSFIMSKDMHIHIKYTFLYIYQWFFRLTFISIKIMILNDVIRLFLLIKNVIWGTHNSISSYKYYHKFKLVTFYVSVYLDKLRCDVFLIIQNTDKCSIFQIS